MPVRIKTASRQVQSRSDSKISNADLVDFTPEMQMANMLGLCEAQMESALQDSDKAVDALIKAFTSLVDATRSVSSRRLSNGSASTVSVSNC